MLRWRGAKVEWRPHSLSTMWKIVVTRYSLASWAHSSRAGAPLAGASGLSFCLTAASSQDGWLGYTDGVLDTVGSPVHGGLRPVVSAAHSCRCMRCISLQTFRRRSYTFSSWSTSTTPVRRRLLEDQVLASNGNQISRAIVSLTIHKPESRRSQPLNSPTVGAVRGALARRRTQRAVHRYWTTSLWTARRPLQPLPAPTPSPTLTAVPSTDTPSRATIRQRRVRRTPSPAPTPDLTNCFPATLQRLPRQPRHLQRRRDPAPSHSPTIALADAAAFAE